MLLRRRSVVLSAGLAWAAAGCADQVVGTFDGSGTAGDVPACDDAADSGTAEPSGCQMLSDATHRYWVCGDQRDWAGAQAFCEGLGATSAILLDPAQDAFLLQAVGQGWYWLGAREVDGEGDWVWVDGTPVGYANWGGTQPDDTAPGQDCLRLTYGIVDGEGWFDGAWDDFYCSCRHRVLCSAPIGP